MFQRILTALALVAVLSVTASADPAPESHHLTIVAGDGQEHVITLKGSAIEIVSDEDGEQSVFAFDLSGLEPMLDGALASAMEELEDLDLNVSVDGDMVVVEQGDSVHAVNLAFVSEAVGELLGEISSELNDEMQVTIEIDEDLDDLDSETAALRDEVRALKKELKLLAKELSRQ